MKVLNLQCAHRHMFEGWFSGEDDFQSQLGRRLIACPLCGDLGIQKMPSAPHLCLGGRASVSDQSEAGQEDAAPQDQEQVTPTAASDTFDASEQAVLLKALRQVVQNTQDVGEQFASEARRMHYGEIERRNIRGQVSGQEAINLLEEGIEVLPLPMLPVLKETLQ